jgi:hypothetical protein
MQTKLVFHHHHHFRSYPGSSDLVFYHQLVHELDSLANAVAHCDAYALSRLDFHAYALSQFHAYALSQCLAYAEAITRFHALCHPGQHSFDDHHNHHHRATHHHYYDNNSSVIVDHACWCNNNNDDSRQHPSPYDCGHALEQYPNNNRVHNHDHKHNHDHLWPIHKCHHHNQGHVNNRALQCDHRQWLDCLEWRQWHHWQ